MSKRASAVADVNAGVILASVEIAAPPARVFRAITQSEEVVKWWGAAEVYRTTGWQADVRPGGRWRAEGAGADGKPFHVEGEYLRVDAPGLLVQTWRPSWDDGPATTVTWRLETVGAGTRLTLRHAGFEGRAESCRGHGDGWTLVLGWLGAHLVADTPAAYFLLKLVPPRPSFMLDMTADERALMVAHQGYWRGQLAAGKVVVFGPVADPTGAYGLGVVRVADAREAASFQANDPVILAGRGFRYETAPMPSAVHA